MLTRLHSRLSHCKAPARTIARLQGALRLRAVARVPPFDWLACCQPLLWLRVCGDQLIRLKAKPFGRYAALTQTKCLPRFGYQSVIGEVG